jgi:hypothetical protein
MTEVDNFIQRWARLKRASSDTGHKAGPSEYKPLEPAETVVPEGRATATKHRMILMNVSSAAY